MGGVRSSDRLMWLLFQFGAPIWILSIYPSIYLSVGMFHRAPVLSTLPGIADFDWELATKYHSSVERGPGGESLSREAQ